MCVCHVCDNVCVMCVVCVFHSPRVVWQGREARPVGLRGRACGVCIDGLWNVRLGCRQSFGCIWIYTDHGVMHHRGHTRPETHRDRRRHAHTHTQRTEDLEDLGELRDVRVEVAPEEELPQPHLQK